jgi:hypothetical protein
VSTPTTGQAAERSTTADAIPIACTLDPQALPGRLEKWRAILDQATSRTARPDGMLRIELAGDVPLGHLADLVAAEQRCCAFLSFAITVDHRGLGLEVDAPADAQQAVAALFGEVAA